jgi:hypothetical protein
MQRSNFFSCNARHPIRLLYASFSLAQCLIGQFEKFVWPVPQGVLPPPCREGDWDLPTLPLYFQRAKAAQHSLDLFQVTFWEQNKELVSAQADRQVRPPNYFVQLDGKFLEHLIPAACPWVSLICLKLFTSSVITISGCPFRSERDTSAASLCSAKSRL